MSMSVVYHRPSLSVSAPERPRNLMAVSDPELDNIESSDAVRGEASDGGAAG